MTSADSDSPRTYLYRLITVRGKVKKNTYAFAKNCYCPRTYLPRTVTVRGRTCHGVLLSPDGPAADVPATDNDCPRTYLQRTITAICRREAYAQATGHLSAFFKISYYSLLTIKKTWIVLVFTFFKISF